MIPKAEQFTKLKKCANGHKNIPNVCKIFQMAIKYINNFLRPHKIYPNWDFWV
jgi:hypothetical protein